MLEDVTDEETFAKAPLQSSLQIMAVQLDANTYMVRHENTVILCQEERMQQSSTACTKLSPRIPY